MGSSNLDSTVSDETSETISKIGQEAKSLIAAANDSNITIADTGDWR